VDTYTSHQHPGCGVTHCAPPSANYYAQDWGPNGPVGAPASNGKGGTAKGAAKIHLPHTPHVRVYRLIHPLYGRSYTGRAIRGLARR
jgi:hypothetical protein